MEKASLIGKRIAESQDQIKQHQTKIDGYRQQQLLLLEEMHGG
jgi:hypothetical protein